MPPWVGFARVLQLDLLAFDAGGPFRAAVDGDDESVQDEVVQSVFVGLFQGLVKVRGLAGQDDGAFVDVALGGGARDAVVGGQSAAMGAQETGQVADQFPGNVECGTIGDQRSRSGVRGFSSPIPLLPGAPFFCQSIGQLFLNITYVPWCPYRPFNLTETTSLEEYIEFYVRSFNPLHSN